ncbi:uncharacterized protein LOC127442173 [Myxocyprinus asiaticus]|uniref:uncharacterized protein LOC127442173 n=1 Tax=Myxocyprinus asiaticus TaxID=70543 RepID=UPI0022227D5E|nr:uncharacterized protein LOC127442173 [Myxocyprinus asiaticus]
MRQLFSIPDDRETKLCCQYISNRFEPLNKPDCTVQDAGLFQGQKQLKETQRKFKQRIQNRDKEVQELKEAVKSYKRSAQKAVEDSERIFTELIRSIERSRSEVTQLIRDQEKAAVCQTEGLLEQLEQEISDLRRRDTELEQLSHTQMITSISSSGLLHLLANRFSTTVPYPLGVATLQQRRGLSDSASLLLPGFWHQSNIFTGWARRRWEPAEQST